MCKTIVFSLFSAMLVVEPVVAEVWYEVEPSQVQHIRAEGRTGLVGYFFQFTQLFPGDDGCSARDFAYIRWDNPLAKEMYSTALAAPRHGRKNKGCNDRL